MRAKNVSAKRIPGWLRWLGWIGFVALFLAACLIVVRSVALRRGHARMQEIVKRHQGEPPLSSQPQHGWDSVAQSASDAGSAQKRSGTPLRDLPVVGSAFSDDPGARIELRNVLAEPIRVLGDTRTVFSFRKALENLGLEVSEDMTEAQAAAEFLVRSGKAVETLAQLRLAAEKGPWEWGQWRIDMPRSEQLNALDSLRYGALLANALIQAHWLSSNSAAAWANWETLQLFAHRAADASSLMGTLEEGRLQLVAARTVSLGISEGAWSDEQLALIPQSLARYDALASLRRGLLGDKVALDELSQRPGDVKKSLDQVSQGRPPSWATAGNWLAARLTSEQQIKDNLALAAADIDYGLARFEYEKRLYVPPSSGEVPPTRELLASDSYLDKWFSTTARSYGGRGSHPWGTIISQTITDQAGIAAALELQRRTTGQYPETLETMHGMLPGGMPHDVATGQPYSYERTSDGGYKVWGTGFDQRNDSGDPRRDIVFTSPEVRPR